MGLEIKYFDGQTPLCEEEIDGLKISSITTREELDEFQQLNIYKSIQQTFEKKRKRFLTTEVNLLRSDLFEGTCFNQWKE